MNYTTIQTHEKDQDMTQYWYHIIHDVVLEASTGISPLTLFPKKHFFQGKLNINLEATEI